MTNMRAVAVIKFPNERLITDDIIAHIMDVRDCSYEDALERYEEFKNEIARGLNYVTLPINGQITTFNISVAYYVRFHDSNDG